MSPRLPRVFIGSSTEGLQVAYAIQENLDYDAEVTVWNQGVFGPSSIVLSKLVSALREFDFAVFVFTPDDLVEMRGGKFSAVRDNVVFELGLFIGRLGLESCFLVKPRNIQTLHLPTDLLGMVSLTYNDERSDGRLVAALGAACNQMRSAFRQAEAREPETISHASFETYLQIWDEELRGARAKIRNMDSDPRSEEFQAASSDIMKIFAFLESLADRVLAGDIAEDVVREKFHAAVMSFWPFFAISRVPPGQGDAEDFYQELPRLGQLFQRWK
ncbi:nucleotide-binding protein [Neorhizobium sp. DT-125]|uniref:nucleotide-binding protein n=1 Tax=Neorhizobium sp. DT-125 TaxID=3396163 RepID=UPI003F19D048